MSKTRVALIGAGGIARYHLRHLQQMDDVDIVAVADVDLDRAKEIAEPSGARTYADHHDLFDAGGMDAVFVCVPPFAHSDQELIAAEQGIPFFTEKPHALSMELTRKVQEAVDRSGVVTAVGFQDRYQDTFDELQAYLKNEDVGLFHGSWIGSMPGVPWWRRKEQSGGQHVEQTIHIFDSVRYLLGDVKSVSASAAFGLMSEVENYNIEDASAVTLTLKSGAVGTIFSACYLTNSGAGKSGLEVYCRESRVEYRLRKSVTYHEKRETRERLLGNQHGFDCDRTFIEAVQSGDPGRVRSPYADASKSLAVVLAADESLKNGGKPVSL